MNTKACSVFGKNGLVCAGGDRCQTCGFNPAVARARKKWLRAHPPDVLKWWEDPPGWTLELSDEDIITALKVELKETQQSKATLVRELADTDLKLRQREKMITNLQAQLLIAKNENLALEYQLKQKRGEGA